ncbi:MAG: hypothetical protein JNJ84_09105, partial [Rhodobacteraceae bacterium]|nr:hypothetical protein [Paracoccaceae bacterium]
MAETGQATGLYSASADFVAHAHVNAEQYAAKYAASVNDPEGFWAVEGQRIDWIKPYT